MALLVTMVMVLLAALLLSSALRTAWFGELIAGTEVDHQRAFEHAQALLRDAELDIQGLCAGEANRPCRGRDTATLATAAPWFPLRDTKAFVSIHGALSERKPPCLQGICISDGVAPEFWRTPAGELDKMKAVAAHYGEFSGAPSPSTSDPLLAARGWYWVEILPFDLGAPLPSGSEALRPDADSPYVYRITAIAEGRKPATRAVLQSLLVWRKAPP
ncbi:pilus assembly protein [Variovorax sp. OV329]|uniref:pilus assembly PilX family protein n=1 Tax=Variovorax sp. OV329 TaxID=1882825 RepID=UPI0008EB7060|nr:pilus assembly protein [Variovorax sp. OV329]SFN15927.1 type IV pilus assembly protein PilX [Variovorax sp. OV329]